MTYNRLWILISDAAGAQIFEKPRDRNFIDGDPKYSMVGMKLRNSDVRRDYPGRTFDSVGDGRHSKDPKNDPARREKSQFAREITQRLEDEKSRNAFAVNNRLNPDIGVRNDKCIPAFPSRKIGHVKPFKPGITVVVVAQEHELYKGMLQSHAGNCCRCIQVSDGPCSHWHEGHNLNIAPTAIASPDSEIDPLASQVKQLGHGLNPKLNIGIGLRERHKTL